MIVSLPLYVPVVAVLVVGYETYSMWAVTVLLAIGLALHRLLHLYQEQREAARGLVEANRRLENANLSFASALVATLDARDQYTAGHSAAVADYARDIAARMGLSPREQEVAHLAGLVHDIGKVGLPVGLLEKRGPLSLSERRQMEQHVVIGERILARVEDYSEIAAIVRHHHERVDGNGYPDGLRGDEIPLLARIIAVADAYDAMTSTGLTVKRCLPALRGSDSPKQWRLSSTRRLSPLLKRCLLDEIVIGLRGATHLRSQRLPNSLCSDFALDHPPRDESSLRSRSHAELFEDVLKVLLHRHLGDEEHLCNLAVLQAIPNEPKYLSLALCERTRSVESGRCVSEARCRCQFAVVR